jgi:single-strand DNA-binding protein
MSFEIEGKLHRKFEVENKTATFQTREFVLEVNANNYMQYIKFQLTQDRCGVIDPFNQGDRVKVHFDLRGREWNDKYFTNLNAWKVEKTGDDVVIVPPPSYEDFPDATTEPVFGKSEEEDDGLPF